MIDHSPPVDMTEFAGSDAVARASGTQRNVFVTEISGWGRYPVVLGREVHCENLEWSSRHAALSRGLGRSYGDASLPAAEQDILNVTTLADRFLAFDEGTGVIRAEAGLSLQKLNEWSLRRGWFVPVTPGTQYVTLGGMAAADVHGKNHHVAGCFGEHITAMRVRVPDGRMLELSEAYEPELFRATIGGMGLTGHILEVALRLERVPSPWIWQESERVADFEVLVQRLQEAGRSWPFTVVWADALSTGRQLGRGVLIKGRWAQPGEARSDFRYGKSGLPIPITCPDWFLAPPAVRAFNRMKYAMHGAKVRTELLHPVSFFYPLDVVLFWNRLYGKRGFTQYQCVLPVRGSLEPHQRLLRKVVAGGGAFLCVIKDCGPEGRGMLSFPKPGISFALDMPVRPGMQALVDELNEIVAAEGGRIYLAKDAFTRPQHFRAMEPRLDTWLPLRHKWDPEGRVRSALSERVFGNRL
jgi:decaprenylphospho-beta-D-ribofuranose 2-oxidase